MSDTYQNSAFKNINCPGCNDPLKAFQVTKSDKGNVGRWFYSCKSCNYFCFCDEYREKQNPRDDIAGMKKALQEMEHRLRSMEEYLAKFANSAKK